MSGRTARCLQATVRPRGGTARLAERLAEGAVIPLTIGDSG